MQMSAVDTSRRADGSVWTRGGLRDMVLNAHRPAVLQQHADASGVARERGEADGSVFLLAVLPLACQHRVGVALGEQQLDAIVSAVPRGEHEGSRAQGICRVDRCAMVDEEDRLEGER